MPKPKNVYALFIGIDEYSAPVSRLYGTKKDVKKFKEYLEGMSDIHLISLELLDEQATKANIVQGILDHLGQAGEGEVALFYYSGHGTQERADAIFLREEPDGKLESIICYDSISADARSDEHNLLADKELYYLFHKLAQKKPHLVSIFDSCNSGGALRTKFLKKQFLNRVDPSYVFPQRTWDRFIFSSDLKYEALRDQSFYSYFPLDQQLHLAATQSDKVALELPDGGAFTQNLIEVLERTSAKVTYFDLIKMTHKYMKNRVQQTPQLDASGVDAKQKFRFFLDTKKTLGNPLYGNILRNTELGELIFDMGHLQGVSKQASEVVATYENNKTTLKIDQVFDDYCTLLNDESLYKWPYKGYIKDFLSAPIKVFIDNFDQDPKAEIDIKYILSVTGKNLLVTEAVHEADYALNIKDGLFSISFPNDIHRPLVPLRATNNKRSLELIANDLKHISQWEYVKQLHNPNTYLFDEQPIQITIERVVKGETIPKVWVNDEMTVNFDHKEIPELKFYLKFTNTSTQPLYLSLLYLSMNFQVYGIMLGNGVVSLQPGEAVYVWNKSPLEFELEKHIVQDNWKYSYNYFQLIANTNYFDISNLQQDALPGPYDEKTRAGRAETRAETNPDASDWITRLLTLKARNPYYDEQKDKASWTTESY